MLICIQSYVGLCCLSGEVMLNKLWKSLKTNIELHYKQVPLSISRTYSMQVYCNLRSQWICILPTHYGLGPGSHVCTSSWVPCVCKLRASRTVHDSILPIDTSLLQIYCTVSSHWSRLIYSTCIH